jgi:cytoskeletal protein CcmA (bactofilin family)
LGMAVHTAGALHVYGGGTLKATGAPASSNGTASIDLNGVITGDLQCTAAVNLGTVSGTTTILAPNKPMPPASIVATYANLGSAVTVGATLTKAVFTPTYATTGSTNADGVYVITTASDLTIKGIRVEGTLVIRCPGKTVTIDQAVLMHNYRADYPVLIVDGNLILQYDSVGTQLVESTWNTSFNPGGAEYPYPNGSSNGNTNDTYPNEIQGLVHCRGTLLMQSTARVRGAIICESASLADAAAFKGTNEIVYDPTLFTNPPMGYAKAVSMVPVAGSWKQVVLP